eukprot:TRINITY_DN8591_c0_g1_i1.p1 TRINITY_DN8591_c0_g1~~TRINITY_DN8591_c0_g1_i1.p1  ORF type:complete len:784 (-),score=132.42 TRINITY_DN8591_c0_g1_i1:22-2295(-)
MKRMLSRIILCCMLFCVVHAQIDYEEQLLSDLFYGFGAPPQLVFGTSTNPWFLIANHCDWLGITCNNATYVEKIELSNMLLTGTISSSIGNFSALNTLDLSFNSIIGSIPQTIGNLKNLNNLLLNSNGFSGSISNELTTLTNLKSLFLSSNSFYGTIPEDLGNLKSLEQLSLSVNLLNGSIPSSLGFLSSLYILDLSHNLLEGEIPDSLGNLNLTILFLYENSLTGTIPSSFSHLKSIFWFSIYINKLSGTIDPFFCDFTALEEFEISNNFFNGTLPACFSDLTSLGSFLISNNNFEGTLPPFNQSGIFNFFVSNNHFRGSLNLNFSTYSNLQYIDLSSNNFSGVVPSSLGNCKQLLSLNASHNQLTSPLPSFLQSEIKSITLDLHNNSFCCPIPEWLIQNNIANCSLCPDLGQSSTLASTSEGRKVIIGVCVGVGGFLVITAVLTLVYIQRKSNKKVLHSGEKIAHKRLEVEKSLSVEMEPYTYVNLLSSGLRQSEKNSNHYQNQNEVSQMSLKKKKTKSEHIYQNETHDKENDINDNNNQNNTNSSNNNSNNRDESNYNYANIVNLPQLSIYSSEMKIRGSEEIPASIQQPPSFTHIIDEQMNFTKEDYIIQYNELKILEQIGQGFSSKVYKGIWHGIEVAIKEQTNPKIEMQSFIKEAILMIKMKPHKYVITTYGILVKPKFMIVTEFVSGGNLLDLLKENLNIGWEVKKKVIQGIITGMIHLHAEGIQHLDLAARSILLCFFIFHTFSLFHFY